MMILTWLLPAMLAAPQDPGPGIDRKLAAARAAQIRDIEYDLRFALQQNSREVEGSLWLRFVLASDRNPSDPVVLDFAGEELREVRVNEKDATLQQVHNHVVVPAELLVRGINGITARFRSKVAASGTPLCVYRDPADGQEYFYTLVVPADAHRLYPCFDQPDLRGRFQIELDLPAEWQAVANTPLLTEQQRPTANGQRWSFARTQPLPTYLMAFACGPFGRIDLPPPPAAGVNPDSKLRLYLRNSMRQHADIPALQRLHHEGLRWLADYFRVPYPFGKLDVVLLPGFPYGGMEHAGAIFYREQALVFDHPPTAAELVRRSTLIYHELCHQWFGNLVTMRWFDDLWLKEGFATFVGYQCLAALEPERQAWLRFLQRVKPRAYEVDSTPGTTPVFQELQNLADAKSAYGAIVYNKAPAVLRELHDRLGAEVFRRGLTQYLQRHAFGSAEWRDLAAALQAASEQDLGRWSSRWLLAPSMPEVRCEWTVDADGKVASATIRQRALQGEGTWPLRLQLLAIASDGSQRNLQVDSDAPAVAIPALVGEPAPAAILCNPQDIAYGQFLPDPRSAAWLLQHTQDLTDPLLRAVASASLWEAVRAAELPPSPFAEHVLARLAVEHDADTHGWLLEVLATTLERYLSAARAAALRERAADMLLGQLQGGQHQAMALPLFRFLVRHIRNDAVLALCRTTCRGEPLPAGLEPGKQDAFLALAALRATGSGDDEEARLRRRFANEDIGKELFLAGAAAATAKAKQAYWEQYLQLDSPPEQWTQDSLPFFHWPGQQELTLPYLQKSLEQVEWVKRNRRIFFMPAWLDGFINGHSSAAALAIVDAFLDGRELAADVRSKLLQSRDGLLRAVRVQQKFPD
jgi:aminopeptidase N